MEVNQVAGGYYNFSYRTETLFPAVLVPQKIYEAYPELWQQLAGKELEEMDDALAALAEQLGYAPLEYFSYSGHTRDQFPFVIGVEESLTDY